jgi:hypothetical protein
LIVTLGGLIGTAGCGEKEEPNLTKPAETADEPAQLPAGWRRHVSEAEGFSVGVPPGWKVRERTPATELRSKGKLVVVSITADRTEDALAVSLDDYAEQTARRLRGFKRLRTGKPRPFRSRYPAIAVRGNGVAKGGVRERLLLVITRRPELAAYAILVVRNARSPNSRDTRRAKRVIRSLTGRPPTGG